MSSFSGVSSPTAIHRSVMAFIDGGYLRKIMQEEAGSDSINFDNLRDFASKRLKKALIQDMYLVMI